jgi:hypothetical protein
LTSILLDPLPQIPVLQIPPDFSSPHHHPLYQFISNNHGCSIQSTFALLTAQQPLKYQHQSPYSSAPNLPASPQRPRRPPRHPAHLVHRRSLRTNHTVNSFPLLLPSLPPKSKANEPLLAKEQVEYTSAAIPATSVRRYNTRWDETAEGSHERWIKSQLSVFEG